jgi:anhydro-N-acetylmuramic acid kinase
VVGDFRPADVALGGTGAPLVPYADYVLRRSRTESRVLLNLGGIANLTYLPAGGTLDDVLAWDVGPGNMLLDAAALALLGQQRDDAGGAAARGSASAAWVEAMLQHEFFARPAPKSAGREDFGGDYARQVLEAARARQLAPADVLASLVELSARAVAGALHQPPLAEQTVDKVYVSGGGRHNAALMRRLTALLQPLPIAGIEALGIDPDAKEAIDFVVLGNETLHGHANNVPQVTGAQRPIVLGAIAPAGLVPRALVDA